MEGLAGLLPFILIILVFWLLLIRPQRRRQQELQRMQDSVEVGEEVMLGAGIAGRVVGIEDEEFLSLEVSPGVSLRVARRAVVRILTEEPGSASPDGPQDRLGDDLDR